MRLPRRPSAAEAWKSVRAEVAAQLDRIVLWTPVAFGIGAAVYLGLKQEPPLWPFAAVAGALLVVAIGARAVVRNRWISMLTALLAICACGALDGKLRSDLVAAPIVPANLGVVTVDGWVMDVASPSTTGERIVIAPVRIDRVTDDQLPFRVRLVVPDGTVLGPGASVRVTALLDPPPGPAAPGRLRLRPRRLVRRRGRRRAGDEAADRHHARRPALAARAGHGRQRLALVAGAAPGGRPESG